MSKYHMLCFILYRGTICMSTTNW